MKRYVLSILMTCSFGCQKQDPANNAPKSSNESSEENKDSGLGNTGALAISENPLAQSYPEGLSVSAFSSDLSDVALQNAVGSLQIDEDAAGLSLVIDRPSQCSGPNTPNGCKPTCNGGQQPPACILPCNQGSSNMPAGCYTACPSSNPPERCYFMAGGGGGTTGGTMGGSTGTGGAGGNGGATGGSGGTGGTGGATGGTQQCYNLSDVQSSLSSLANERQFDSIEALKQATKSSFEKDSNYLKGSPLDVAPKILAQNAKDRLAGKASCVSDELEASLEMIKTHGLTENLDGAGCYRPDWGIIDGKFGVTNEVCMVGFVRNETSIMGAYVTFAQRLMEAMICQAKVDKLTDKELQVGEELDLGDSLSASVTVSSLKIKSATVAREDDVDARKTFTTTFSVGVTGGRNPDGSEFPFDIDVVLRHTPGEEGNNEYDGVLSISHLRPLESVPYRKALSLSYSKRVDDVGARIKYELRSGSFHKSYTLFDSDGILNFNTGASFTGSTDGASYGAYQTPTTALNLNQQGTQLAKAMNYIQYDGYPEIGPGKMSYWVNFGDTYTERARGFIFDTKVEDGQLKGCGYAGAVSPDLPTVASNMKLSIRRAVKEGSTLTPGGYWRPFLCSKTSAQPDKTGYKIWRQCFTRNDEGQYVVDAEKTEDETLGFDFIATRDESEAEVITIKPPTAPPPPPKR